MNFQETEIQSYIWEHKDDLFSMIEKPTFEEDPNKKPWEYEPWELLYYQLLKEYKEAYELLEDIDIFGCEVRLPKEGEGTIRTDFLGSFEGENGFIICELKVNRQPERQSYTELFAYANHIRSVFAPMGRRDIFYMLITPMEERIVREATISNLLYERNREVVLIPEVGETIGTLKFKLWIPSKKDFEVYAKTLFAKEDIDTFRISWRGALGKWSPIGEGKCPTPEMIHQLNKVSQYAAQLMEANGINGFVYCCQSYPEVRERGFLENGITICGINPFKSAKTRYLLEKGASIKIATEASSEFLGIDEVLPGLKNSSKDLNSYESHWYLMAEAWSSCIDRIAFDVVDLVNLTFGSAHYERGYGTFTWDSYLYNSSEDVACWNYDISLTGIFREIYHLKLQRHYEYASKYSEDEKCEIMESGILELHCIDMMYSHEHIRDFIKGLFSWPE